MDYQKIKDLYINKKFITIYIIIFIVLFIFCTFIKFLGQWPILLIISFIIAYYIVNKFNSTVSRFLG